MDPITPIQSIPEEERKAYQELIERFHKSPISPEEDSEKVIGSEKYKAYVAIHLGCEIVSFYVMQKNATDIKTEQGVEINFLHEVTAHATDYPMYMIREGQKKPYQDVQEVEESTRQIRRASQKKILSETQEQKTSANLCARYLRNENSQGFLLLHFGEIIAYSYLYLILPSKKPDNTPDWFTIGRSAWNKLTNAHKDRWKGEHQNQRAMSVELLEALREWYTIKKADRNYARPGINTIKSIYELEEDLKGLLQKARSDQSAEDDFLKLWAEKLFNSLIQTDPNREDFQKAFWERTLINPNIELLFMTRGLFVTIIHSPISNPIDDDGDETIQVSEAHAICTVFDASLLEDADRRANLVHLLRTMSYDDIVTYDYGKLKRLQTSHKKVQDFLNDASSPDYDLRELLHLAAVASQRISSATHVIVSLKNTGSYVLAQSSEPDNTKMYYTGWFKNITHDSANKYIELLKSFSIDMKKKFSEMDMHMDSKLKLRPVSVSIEDKDHKVPMGSIVLFTNSESGPLPETIRSLEQIATAISIGAKLPFRTMINQGMLNWMLSLIAWLISFIIGIPTLVLSYILSIVYKNVAVQIPPRFSGQHWTNVLLPTMLDAIQLIFFSVGISFICAILRLFPWNLMPWDHYTLSWLGFKIYKSASITDILGHVEKTVMAFSVCLAATGILFLLKPQLKNNQPGWMQRFAEPGTLEQTLVKLAAMVLTIDVLSVVLRLQNLLQSSTTYLWILVKPATFHLIAYLVILVGLAFLSKFVLSEEEEHDKIGHSTHPTKGVAHATEHH